MPGIIYHLAFAEEVYRHIPKTNAINQMEFFLGNLIPDLVVPENKKQSHYRVPASFPGFVVPNMEEVKKDLYHLDNSLEMGMYCHLYLDYHFFETFLIPEFQWDLESKLVINPRTGKSWSAEQFFAKAAKGGILYSGYTQINKLMIQDGHINKKTLDMLPDELPLTGNPIFDTRREKTWREELNGYLAEDVEYTGEPFDYARLWSSISRIATKFVSEEL